MFILVDSIMHGMTIIRTSDNTSISCEETNPDYREYLAWLAEGNVPEHWEKQEPKVEEVPAEEPVIEDAN